MSAEAEDFDRQLLAIARRAGDMAYDPALRMIAMKGSPTSVHTRMTGRTVHAYRQSATYALTLLESGDAPQAAEVLDRVLDGQDRDPASETFGVWPYYREEPFEAMVRPDPNWADFIGQDLVLIMLRHESALPAPLRDTVRAAIEHAAQAIIRRNVSMSYTNIAVKGTLVTLAAGQLLEDRALLRYGRKRIGRLAETIDATGSFAEYNSPTYWLVTCTAMTAISQLVEDGQARGTATRLVDLLWRHFGQRWHPPTGQLAGPMSRAYAHDLADEPSLLAYLAKAVHGRPPFDDLLDRLDIAPAHALELATTAILRPQAPADVVRRLTGAVTPGLRRELFSRAQPDRVGSTWLDGARALGTINFADCWFQRRNVLGFWSAGERVWEEPTRFVRLRVIKDDFDFVSGVLSSVQNGPHALWHIGIVSPGGDRHVHRDVIEKGEAITLRSLRVSFELQVGRGPSVQIDGRPADVGSRFLVGQQVTVTDAGSTVVIRPAAGGWGDATPSGRIGQTDDGLLHVDLELVDAAAPTPVDLSRLGVAYAGGGVSLLPAGHPGLRQAADAPVSSVRRGDLVEWAWQPAGQLTLTGRATVGDGQQHAGAYTASVDGRPPQAQRLDTGGSAGPVDEVAVEAAEADRRGQDAGAAGRRGVQAR